MRLRSTTVPTNIPTTSSSSASPRPATGVPIAMSRLRPYRPMLAFTPLGETRSRLALTWGIETFLVPPVEHTDEFAYQTDSILLSLGRAVEGDQVIIVAGSPPGTVGSTNLIHVHRIGEDDH